MAELLINKNKISNNVIPNIKNSKIYMEKSLTDVNNILKSLPSDFSGRSTTLNIKSEIEYLNSDIEKLLSFFYSKVKSINEMRAETLLTSFSDNIISSEVIPNSYDKFQLRDDFDMAMTDSYFLANIQWAIQQVLLEKSQLEKEQKKLGFDKYGLPYDLKNINSYNFKSTKDLKEAEQKIQKRIVKQYKAWKNGIVDESEFIATIRNYYHFVEASQKFLNSGTYYQSEIERLKKENEILQEELEEDATLKNLNSQLERLELEKAAAARPNSGMNYNQIVEQIKNLENKILEIKNEIGQNTITKNNELIAQYTKELAYLKVQNIYDSEMNKFKNSAEYDKINVADAKNEFEDYISEHKNYRFDIHETVYTGVAKELSDYKDRLNDEDVKMVYYYFKNHSEDDTKKFIMKISPIIDQHYASKIAEDYETAEGLVKFGMGTSCAVSSGFESIANSYVGLVKMITNDDSYTFAGAYTQALSIIQQLEDSQVLKYWYSAVQSTVAQAPGVALSFVPYVGTYAALSYSAAYSAGNSYVEDVNAGKDADKARTVAVMNAGIELGTSILLGSVPVEGALTKKFKSSFHFSEKPFSKIVNTGAKLAIDVGGEVVEELVQDNLSIMLDNKAYNENRKYTFNDAKDTAIVTAMSTLLLKGVSAPMTNFYQNNVNLPTNLDISDLHNLDINSFSNYRSIVDIIASKLPENVRDLYNKARQTGNKFAIFLGYEEHNFLHVIRVADTSVKVLTELNKIVDNGSTTGLSKIDENIVYFAGLCHDLGMAEGGYVLFRDGTFAPISDVTSNLKKYDSQLRTLIKNYDKIDSINEIEGQIIRSQHPLNSAIDVLKNRSSFTGYEDSIDLIACLTLIHSKSTSGVKDVTSAQAVSQMIKKLYDNQSQGDYIFKISNLVELDANGNPLMIDDAYAFKPNVLETLSTGAIALRVGDAHAEKTGYNHGGNKINVVERVDGISSVQEYENTKQVNRDFNKLISNLCQFESQNSNVTIGSDQNNINLSGGSYDYSKQIVLGESNVVNRNSYYDQNSSRLVHTFKVKSADSPACTFKHGIMEKFGEYYTFPNIKQHIVIELPSDSIGIVKMFYQEMVNSYKQDARFKGNVEDFLTFEIKISDLDLKLVGDDLLKIVDNYKTNETTDESTSGYHVDLEKHNILSEDEKSQLIENKNSFFGFDWIRNGILFSFSSLKETLSNRKERIYYLKLDRELFVELVLMRRNGATIKEMAQYAVYSRNLSKLETRSTGSLKVKCEMAIGNIMKYGYLDTILATDKFQQYFEINNKGKVVMKVIDNNVAPFQKFIDNLYIKYGIDNNTINDDIIYKHFLEEVTRELEIIKDNQNVQDLTDDIHYDFDYVEQHALGKTFEEFCFSAEAKLKSSNKLYTEEDIYELVLKGALSPNRALNVALGIPPEISYSYDDIDKYVKMTSDNLNK